MQEVCICRKPWNLTISEKYFEALNVLPLAQSCIPPTANYSLFSFLASLKLYHFQDFLMITRTPVARILAITLEKKLSMQNIHQNERRRHDGMWSVRVKKRKGIFLWKGDFPVEEGLFALVYAHLCIIVLSYSITLQSK